MSQCGLPCLANQVEFQVRIISKYLQFSLFGNRANEIRQRSNQELVHGQIQQNAVFEGKNCGFAETYQDNAIKGNRTKNKTRFNELQYKQFEI